MKRKHTGRSQTPGKRGGESKERGRLEERSQLCGIVPLLVGVIVLAAALYLIAPSDFTGNKRSEESRAPQRYQGESEQTSEGEFVNSGVSCDKLMKEAKRVLDRQSREEWESALDMLATCALQEPQNPAPRWNLAVALIQMDRTNEALRFIDEALELDPQNVEYLKTGGAFLSRMGYHSEAVRCLEWYLEVSLHVPSWEHLLASISVQREDEWAFLHDAGEDVIPVLEVLLSSYLHSSFLIKAGYLYKVLIGLKGPDPDPELLAAYSFFAFGLGDLVTGIKYLRQYTEYQYTAQGYGDEGQAFEVVTAHSLRLFSAGFDSHIISIGKNLLMAGQAVFDELVYNCDLPENDTISNFSQSVSQSDLRKILIRCLLVQKVIPRLCDEGAVVYAENMFGWRPLLHTAKLGSPEVILQLTECNGDPHSHTALGHNALHVAAMQGNYDIVPQLLDTGLSPSSTDHSNHTAMQIACLHRWTAEGMARALHVPFPPGCPSPLEYVQPLKHVSHGGWLGSGVALPNQLTQEQCDFDVIAASETLSFLSDYLALQRPVLVRNAANNHEMKSFFQKWQRNKFEQEYGALTFNEVDVPFAESFRYKTNKTSLKGFMAKMKQLYQSHQTWKAELEMLPHPTYIFETIPLDSPLLKDFKLPNVLNPNVTHISVTKMQFYLGPALSGAPQHFHRSAWNVLVFGQKRWFLFPPTHAIYSRQHVWEWWKGRSHTSGLECVQHPGDLVFVPDMWGHAVINLRESIGFASEFVYGASEFSI